MAERDKIGEAVLRAAEFIEKRPITGEVSAIDVDFSRVISGYDIDIPLDVPYYGMRPGRYVLDERDMADEGGAVYATSRDQIVNHAKDPEKHQDVMATSLDVEAAEAWARESIDPKRLYTIKGGISLAGVLASVARVISILIALEKAHKSRQPRVTTVGKQWSEAMSATTKREKYERPDGEEFVEAGDLVISSRGAGGLSVSASMKKTLTYINSLATGSGYRYEEGRNCEVVTSLDEIMEARGVEDTRKNRARVRSDIEALARWAWEWRDEKRGEWERVQLSSGASIERRGVVRFWLTDKFMRAVLNPRKGHMPTNPKLLQTDDKRNPYAFVIGYKLTNHSYQNAGKPNQNTISVRKLLEYVEDMPKPDEVKGRNHTQKIIEPMERDLNALISGGVLKWWDYCHTNGEPLTDAEQAERIAADGTDRALPYATAINANIQWELAERYEGHMAGVEKSRERRRQEAEDAKQKADARKERIDRQTEKLIAKNRAERA